MKDFPAKIDAIKYLYLRAGDEHGFIPVWVVVVDGRVLVRSWNDKPTGWFRAFLREPRGAVRIGDREMPVRAAPVKDAAILDAMEDAYAAKYATKANFKYVKGFRSPKRRATTMELRPATSAR
jgi:hypothetical protein